MSKYIRFLAVGILFFASLSVVFTVRAALVVHPGNLQGWFIGSTLTMPSFADFVNGPGVPPLGSGSYRVEVTTPGTKVQMGRADYNGTPFSSLSITYNTHREASANLQGWYVNIYVDRTGSSTTADCRIDFNPQSGPLNTWVTHNTATDSRWIVSTGACPGFSPLNTLLTFSQVVSALPPATVIRSPFTPGAPAIVFNMGDSASTYVGYKGAIDAITINGTTWDLELVGPPAASVDFFNPGDCRVDPRPGDRLAICCEANRIVVYGVANNSRGFLLSTFDFEDLAKAGRRGIFINKDRDGVISASMSKSEHMWVAWNGGQYNATGQPDQGFAKLVRCPLPGSVIELLKQRSE